MGKKVERRKMSLVSDRYARSRGFTPSDPARTYKQARELAKSYPDDMDTLIVKTGKKGDTYPYTIYVKDLWRM